MKIVKNLTNAIQPSVEYPNGDIADASAPGVLDGTPINRASTSDIIQLVNKVFDDYENLTGTVRNDLPDNETNGYQLYDAFKKVFKGYYSYIANLSQSGAVAPTAVQTLNNDFDVNWTYDSAGLFYGEIVNLPGGGPVDPDKLTAFITPAKAPFGQCIFHGGTSPDDLAIHTTNDVTTGTGSNGILTRSFVEVRYKI